MKKKSYGENASTRNYFREISEYPLLSRQEELDLARLVAKGDEDARNKLIVSNLRLVIKIAHKFKGLGLPIQDVIAYGNAGLIIAAEKYNAEKAVEHGAKFSSYASWWIKKEIRRALTECGSNALIMIKSTKASRVSTFRNKREMLQLELGRKPTYQELMDATGKTKRMIKILEEVDNIGFVYLDDDRNFDKYNGVPDKEFLKRENSEHLNKAMECLNDRERLVLTLKFGLDGGPERTLREIGKELQRSSERVRQIKRQALGKLKVRMEEMEVSIS